MKHNDTFRSVPFVDLSAQFLSEREQVLSCVNSVFGQGNFVDGDEINDLENELAAYCKTSHAVTLNSGTDALVLAMRAFGIGHGDEVITPPNSFIASTSAIVAVGAKPVFIDVRDDQNIDARAIEYKITKRTRALMPVHLTGRVADMHTICAIARRHDLLVFEDAAQSVGSRISGRMSGSFGDAGCFSLHPLKNLNAAGDAGFVTTNNDEAANWLRKARNHGLKDRNTVEFWGGVSRLDTLQAALIRLRLKKLNSIITQRRHNAQIYKERLAALPVLIPPCRPNEYNTFHTFVIQIDKRDALQQYLSERGVGTGIHYPVPIHLQPAAKDLGYKLGDFPRVEAQANRILSLPVHQFLDPEDLHYVCECIKEFFS